MFSNRLLLILALLCSPAFAANTLVQSNSIVCATTTSCALTLGTGTTTGNLLTFKLMWGAQTGTITPCDGASCSTTCATSTDTWSTVPSNPVSDTVSGGNEINMAYAIASSSVTSFTYCVSGGGSHTLRIEVSEYSSGTGWLALASVLHTSSVNHSTGTGTSAVQTNVTPATGELIVSAFEITGVPTANSFSVSGTGFTEEFGGTGTGNTGGAATSGWGKATRADGCDNTNSGNTATACTLNWTTSVTGYAATAAVFTPAAGGGSAAPPTMMTLGVGD